MKTLILLDDINITDQCSPALDITASEGDNRTATVTLYPGSGPINITSYQGRRLEIFHRLGADWTWVALFAGTVDVPTYRRDSRSLQLRCSDLRGERLGREDQARLMTLTGGAYADTTQREDAVGEQWVRELMKTVEGSLDYTGSGALRYRPWPVAAPRYTLGPADIHHREVSLEFATRSEIVNRVPISCAFRWYKRRTETFDAHLSMRHNPQEVGGTIGRLPHRSDAAPTREAITDASKSINNWHLAGDIEFKGFPPNGWYSISASSQNKVAYIARPNFRALYAMGFSASFVRYISQAMRMTDAINVEAPESVDQFGPIDGSPISLSIDTHVDPAVFEESGCYNRAEQDRAADRAQAIEIAQRMAAREIRGSHRKNYAAFRYKPSSGQPGADDLLPVEIGDTLQVTTDEVIVTGWVGEFRHAMTATGERYTDIKLAVSRVDSDVTVSDNLAVPPVGTPHRTNPEAQAAEDTVCGGGAGSSQDEAPKVSGIARDGTVTLVAPAIAANKTDELVGEANHTYSIAIPVDSFTVEVP